MSDSVKVPHTDKFSCNTTGISMTCYMADDPLKCYVTWESESDEFSQSKLKGFLEEASANDDFLLDDMESCQEILEIPYSIHDETDKKDVPVVHLPSFMTFCNCIRSVYDEDHKAFSDELLRYVDKLVYVLLGCSSDMISIQAVKWRLNQQSKLVGRSVKK